MAEKKKAKKTGNLPLPVQHNDATYGAKSPAKKSGGKKNMALPSDPYGADGYLSVDAKDEIESPEDNEILQEIKQKYTECRSDTVIERLNYWLNYSFWRGDQWLWVPSISKELIDVVTPTAKRQREQATVNKIAPALRTTISKIQEAPIGFEVESESADDYTSMGARKGESILRTKILDDDWETLTKKWTTTALIGGYAALLTVWDSEAHRYADGISTGDAYVKVLTPESCYIQPGVDSARDARWAIVKEIMPPSSAKAAFNLDYMPPADGEASGPFSVKAFDYCRNVARRRGTQVLWYYEKPNALRPKGLIAAVIASDVVFGPVDYTSVYPFEDLCIDVGGVEIDTERWTYKTPVSQALSVQRQINHIWTKIHETLHRTAGTKLLADKRHDIGKSIDDDPETPLLYQGMADAKEPHWLAPPSLPTNTMDILQTLYDDLNDQLAVHAVSQGDSPGSIESGFGVQQLAEQDSTPSGNIGAERARVFGSSASKVLKLYSVKVKNTRKARSAKGHGLAQTVKWTGADLAEQTRAVVPPDGVEVRSKSAQRKLAMELLQQSPPASPGTWFPTFASWAQFADLPGFDKATEALDVDTYRAEWEDYQMGEGIAVRVDPDDDDLKHIAQHVHFKKSPEFGGLSQKSQDLVNLHIINHRRQLAHKAGMQQAANQTHPALGAAMAPVNGMPGPAGPGGPPPQGPPAPPQPQLPQGPTGPPQLGA